MGRFSRGDHLFTSRMVGLNILLEIKRKIGDPWGTVQEKPFKTAVEEWRAQAKTSSWPPSVITGRMSWPGVPIREHRFHRPLAAMPSMPYRLAELIRTPAEHHPMDVLINSLRQPWRGADKWLNIKFTTPNMEPDGPPPNDDWHNRTKLERMRPSRRPEAKAAAMKQWHEEYMKTWPGITHLTMSSIR